jgi:hypothetical protein
MSAVVAPNERDPAEVGVDSGQYFGAHDGHEAITDEIRESAHELVCKVNPVIEAFVSDGGRRPHNEFTECEISGHGNGGWRPPESKVGAAQSTHKSGHGVDIYDPYRALATWLVDHPEVLLKHGLHVEDFRWTPSWVHFQDVPPKSGRLMFIPSRDAPMASAIPGQQELSEAIV